jgi:hypothetical protein
MDILKDKLWLVKVPEVVYNQITKGKDVGYMDVYETLDSKKEIRIHLGDYQDDIKFDLQYEKTESFFGFREKKNRIKKLNYIGRFVANDERVSDRVTMSVAKEQLTNKASIAIEYSKGRPISDGIIPISEHQFYATSDNYQKAVSQKNRKEKNLKKTRMEKEELKKEIFNLFSQRDYWTNKELVNTLDQPENYLKEVLSEMCNPIRSGPKKGCYELKNQYIRTKNEDELSDDNF